jgi:hypothetical protein
MKSGEAFVRIVGSVVACALIASGGTLAHADGVGGSQDGGGVFVGMGFVIDTAGNSVMEPEETVVLAPTWMNAHINPNPVTGTTSNFTGPAGPLYTNPDNTADYGVVGTFSTGSCTATGNCYTVRASSATRPAIHWDSSILEIVNGFAIASWTIHIGASFSDLPVASPFYRFVETILHRNVTSGCGGGAYCPAASTSREQMAVFVLVTKGPAGYQPPPCGATPMFADVPVASPFCPWVEELARRGVTSGCAPGFYCPSAAVARDQMAVFVLRTLDPALSPPACTTPMFGDVAAGSPFCPWIEELARRGVVSGCGGGNYCPASPVSREQMAVFLTGTFGLRLY